MIKTKVHHQKNKQTAFVGYASKSVNDYNLSISSFVTSRNGHVILSPALFTRKSTGPRPITKSLVVFQSRRSIACFSMPGI